MRDNKPGTKILVDGGDPEETLRIKKRIGFVDGQTTNPSLIAKNPEVGLLRGRTLCEAKSPDGDPHSFTLPLPQ